MEILNFGILINQIISFKIKKIEKKITTSQKPHYTNQQQQKTVLHYYTAI